MNVKNEIKSIIVRSGMTMQQVVDLLSEEYGWSDSISNFSNKLSRGSLRYREAISFSGLQLILKSKAIPHRKKCQIPQSVI